MRRWWSMLILLIGFSNIYAQQKLSQNEWSNDDKLAALLEQLIELVPEEQLEDGDWSDLMEYFVTLYHNPLDINQATYQELFSLSVLSPKQIQELLTYRTLTGGFTSITELQVISDLDIELAQLLSEFLVVRSKTELSNVSLQEWRQKAKHELSFRWSRVLENQLGYGITDTNRSRYLGSPERMLIRYRVSVSPNIKIAINAEKDPGEEFSFKNKSYGFDFYSGNFSFKNQGKLKQLIIGDYVTQFGQGLSMWGGYAGGKGTILHGIARQGMGIKPHTSFDEVNFLRGIAGQYVIQKWNITPYFSIRNRDGSVEVGEGQDLVQTLGTSGLHRTPTEIRNRNQVKQWTYGISVERQSILNRWGVNFYTSQLSASILPQPLLRNAFSFSGKTMQVFSLYHNLNFRNIYTFAECAYVMGGNFAHLYGALISLHPHLSLGMVYRDYDKSYHSLYGNAFGSGSEVTNEKGFYFGLHYQPHKRFQVISYIDRFEFPWAKFRVDGPSNGYDFLTQLSYNFSKRKSITIRYRHRLKQLNFDLEEPHNLIVDTEQQQLRLNFEYKWADSWKIRSRVEWVKYAKELQNEEFGWLFFHDLFYQPLMQKWSGNVRMAYFNTGSYDSRIYAYENDVLYSSAMPAYQNKGLRTYLNLRVKINAKLDFWTRYALTYSLEDKPLGSGLDLIENDNKRSELKLQVRIKIP